MGLTGLSAIITAFIPEAVVLPILVFVGISSYSQAFEVVTKKYYPAVIMASLPVVMDFMMDNVAEGKLQASCLRPRFGVRGPAGRLRVRVHH